MKANPLEIPYKSKGKYCRKLESKGKSIEKPEGRPLEIIFDPKEKNPLEIQWKTL